MLEETGSAGEDLQIVPDFISVVALPGFFLCPDPQILFLSEDYTCVLETLFVDVHLPHLEGGLSAIYSIPQKVIEYLLCALCRQ